MGSESDHNVFACNSWIPRICHNWNDSDPLDVWQKQYTQDAHSIQILVVYERFGNRFQLQAERGLNVAGPLPRRVTDVWRPANLARVGADLTAWNEP